MKALSGYAEWFWLMAKNWKPVENRKYPLPRSIACDLPVRIYLHASRSDHAQNSNDLGLIYSILAATPERWWEFCNVDWAKYRGHIIGEITITKQMRKFQYTEVDYIDIGSQQKELEILEREREPCISPWFFGPYGYAVEDGVLYDKPILCRGKLGFFKPDIDILTLAELEHKETREVGTDIVSDRMN